MADLQTYVPIATQTLGSAAASVTFSSIPSTYTDLVLVASAACTSGTAGHIYQLNGDTGTNYSYTDLYGSGSAAGSTRDTNTASPLMNYYSDFTTTLGASTTTASWLNYSNSTTYKTVLSRSGTGNGFGTSAIVSLWRNTAAITSILLKSSGATYATGSTFTLYGIKAA